MSLFWRCLFLISMYVIRSLRLSIAGVVGVAIQLHYMQVPKSIRIDFGIPKSIQKSGAS